MIARFTDLDERLVVNKNTTLKDFVCSKFSEKMLDKTILKDIVYERHAISMNLTDGKPGDWCILKQEDFSYIVQIQKT